MGRSIKQVNVFDGSTGQLVATSTKYVKSVFGVGWVTLNKKACRSLFKRCGSEAIKIFFYLAVRQTYEPYVKVSVLHLATELGLGRSTAFRAVKELEDSNAIQRSRVDGQIAFLLNPTMTSCGRAAVKERQQLWRADKLISEVTGLEVNDDDESDTDEENPNGQD